MPERRPSTVAIIIGAMKGGTTSLYRYLAQHPEVAPSRIKEPGFFAFDDIWCKGVEWYFGLWRFDQGAHKVALEASTDYTKRPYFPHVPEKMTSIEGVRFRFIYVMRHPLRRIESQARHAARTHAELGHLIETDRDFSLDCGISERAISISRYAYQIDAYMDRFERGDLLLLTSEELKYDPLETCRRVCDFLEISQFATQVSLTWRKYNTADENILPHPVVALSSRIGTVRHLVSATVPPHLRKRLRRIGARGVPGRFSLTAGEEAKLLTLLAPDLLRLDQQYGIDILRHWGIRLEPEKIAREYGSGFFPPSSAHAPAPETQRSG